MLYPRLRIPMNPSTIFSPALAARNPRPEVNGFRAAIEPIKKCRRVVFMAGFLRDCNPKRYPRHRILSPPDAAGGFYSGALSEVDANLLRGSFRIGQGHCHRADG